MLALAQAFPKQATQSTQVLKVFKDLDGKSLLKHLGKKNRKPRGCFSYLFWLLFLLGAFAGVLWLIFFYLDPEEKIPQHPEPQKKQKIRVQKEIPKPRMAQLQLPFIDLFQNNQGDWPLQQQFKALFQQKPNDYRIRTLEGERLTTACPGKLRSLQQPLSVQLQTSAIQTDKEGQAVHGLALFFNKVKEQSHGYYVGIDPPLQKAVIAKLTAGKWQYLRPWGTVSFPPSENKQHDRSQCAKQCPSSQHQRIPLTTPSITRSPTRPNLPIRQTRRDGNPNPFLPPHETQKADESVKENLGLGLVPYLNLGLMNQ